MRVLLVSPAVPATFWSFRHILPLLSKKAAFPPLGLLTVAAMLPRKWELRLVDLDVRPLRDDDLRWADYVMVSAMIVHEASVRQVVQRCRAAGKSIIAGGPLFTTGHERFPEISHFVLGEAEPIMAQLVADMEARAVKAIYEPEARPSLDRTPSPRWDLIRLNDYATMSLQFSRGCPFDCEFCDIIEMYGRTPRTKSSAAFVRELDSLWKAGWRGAVFVVDDNFIGHKSRARELLVEIAAWQARRSRPLAMLTEASLNLADDRELVRLMVQAGFRKVFVGVETPDEVSLSACGKVQNTRRDLVAAVHSLQEAGLEVMGGFIVGFDSDARGIFRRQHRFIQSAGIVTAMVGLLTALPQTRLFRRLEQEGRLLKESTGNNLDAVMNFIPRMDRERLVAGYRRLLQRLYAPSPYYRRVLTFLARYRPTGRRSSISREEVIAFIRSMWMLGVRHPGRRAYWSFFVQSLLRFPRSFGQAMDMAIKGHHFRMVAAEL